MAPVEHAVLRSVKWLLAGLAAALALLAVPRPDEHMGPFLLHLSALVVLGYLLTLAIWDLADDGAWYAQLRTERRLFATAASVTVIVTGVVALVTLASSAALRLAPSAQFLQLLSALDIAWSVTALMIGVRWLWGRKAGIAAGAMLSVVCVFSIWLYLDRVGFGPNGEWIVDGAALSRLVLPFDVAAAMMAIGSVLTAIRIRATAPTSQPASEQPRPQS